MKNFLAHIIADPYTPEPLKIINGLLVNAAGEKYIIQDGIPDFITGKDYTPAASAFHNRYGTQFFYRGHYKADASYFNYEDGDDNKLTAIERKRSRQAVIDEVNSNSTCILDIGCGDGWVAKHFTAKNINVVSMDLAITNPHKALQKYPSDHHAAVVADAMYLPFQNASFDVIIASEVTEHLAAPAEFIKHCLEKVKPGGKLILITPYNEKIEYYICVHCNLPTPRSAHLHSFNEKNIRNIIGADRHYKTFAFNNKWFLKLRIYNLLQFLPFSAWKLIDSIANSIFRRPTTFRITIQKPVI